MGTLVVAAMERELRPLARALGLEPERVAGCRVWVGGAVAAAAVGVGPKRAASGISALLEELDAARVLVVGVAGAANGPDPRGEGAGKRDGAGGGAGDGGAERADEPSPGALQVGDLLSPVLVIDARTTERFEPHHILQMEHRGVLRSVPRFEGPAAGAPRTGHASTRTDPSAAHDERAVPAATDMETAAVARVCVSRALPWDALRAISDVPGSVTNEVAGILDEDGRPNLVRLLGLLVRRPRLLARLVRVAGDFRVAVGRLTRALEGALTAEAKGSPDGNRRVVPPPSR